MRDSIPDTLAALRVPVDSLKHYGKNPRTGDVDAIAESLKVNGQYRPVVVNERTNEVLAGNHTLKAARKLGWSEIAATYVDVDDEQAARIVLVDNRSNDLAEYDDSALVELLQDIEDLAGSGFSDQDLADLLAKVTEVPPGKTDPDEVPDPPAEPISKLGDVWQLGPHRVVCGDSTDVGVLDVLLQGSMVDMVWTDPPYGVAYVGGGRAAAEGTERKRIANDELSEEQLTDFLSSSLGAAFASCKEGGAWYVAGPGMGAPLRCFVSVLADFGVLRQMLVWTKDSFVMGRSDYHGQFEPIFYGWKPGAAHHAVADRTQSTVWECPRPRANAEHPTMKPVALIERALENSSKNGAVVLDPFGGSGSTLIAAHAIGRIARLVELDPRYVDVICRRYQEHTGDKPVLESTGEPHDFTG